MKLYLIRVIVPLVLYILNDICSKLTGKYITKNQDILMAKGTVVGKSEKKKSGGKSIEIGTLRAIIISLIPGINVLFSLILLIMLVIVLLIKASMKRVVNS